MDDAGRFAKYQKQLTGLLTSDQLLVGIHNQDDILCYANPLFRKVFNVRPGEAIFWPDMIRRCYAQQTGPYLHTDNVEHWLIDACGRRGKTPYRSFEVDMHNGQWFILTEIILDDGELLTFGTDITHLRQSTRARKRRIDMNIALRAARTDALTGALNRRGILQTLEKQVTQLQAEGTAFCLVLMDLDHFKAINDTYGHDVGDDALRHFVHFVHDKIRRSDIFGRYGCEEFLLILPYTDLQRAQETLQRLHDCLPPLKNAEYQTDIDITFSAGLVSVTEHKPTKDLLKTADNAMYTAKQAGRCCTRVGNF